VEFIVQALFYRGFLIIKTSSIEPEFKAANFVDCQ